MLGNPDDTYLMEVTGGYYGMGATPGWLYLLAWPTDEVVDRIAHCAVHEFHHQVRYSNVEWNPVTVTVGEHAVAEGLAEALVRELSGPEAMGPWSSRVTGNAFEDAWARTMADIELQGMQNTPAFVVGDTAAVRFGGMARCPGYGRIRRRSAHSRQPSCRDRDVGCVQFGVAERRDHPAYVVARTFSGSSVPAIRVCAAGVVTAMVSGCEVPTLAPVVLRAFPRPMNRSSSRSLARRLQRRKRQTSAPKAAVPCGPGSSSSRAPS